MNKRSYTIGEVTLIKRLRFTHKPWEIAQIVGRTEGAIIQILHREKLKGAEFPKLRHGRLKYDRIKAQAWRLKVIKGMNYRDIGKEEGVSPPIISRVLAAELRGELRW